MVVAGMRMTVLASFLFVVRARTLVVGVSREIALHATIFVFLFLA